MRNLASSAKNAESFALLERERTIFHKFLDIMKKYAIVGILSGSIDHSKKTES
jgi:hypothetical protein